MIYLCDMKIDKINQIILDSKTEDVSQVSDGWHTFSELYKIRLAYNVALFNEWAQQQQASETEFVHLNVPRLLPKHDVHKSQRHYDGELCFGGGWFIVVANPPSGQISNHYEEKYWDLFKIPNYEKAKYEWDGHTTDDVIKRLLA